MSWLPSTSPESFPPSSCDRAAPFTFFFFFPDTAPPEIYTLSLHDALPICTPTMFSAMNTRYAPIAACFGSRPGNCTCRSEEHTSELQSQFHLVCRLLL